MTTRTELLDAYEASLNGFINRRTKAPTAWVGNYPESAFCMRGKMNTTVSGGAKCSARLTRVTVLSATAVGTTETTVSASVFSLAIFPVTCDWHVPLLYLVWSLSGTATGEADSRAPPVFESLPFPTFAVPPRKDCP